MTTATGRGKLVGKCNVSQQRPIMVSRLGSSNLLKPARDLAQNWSIDVASELEAYLTQVEQQHHNARAKDGTSLCSAGNAEDDDQKPFNFIEAALMLSFLFLLSSVQDFVMVCCA